MARRGFMDLLAIPWVDKTISVVACVPFAVELQLEPRQKAQVRKVKEAKGVRAAIERARLMVTR